MKNYQSGQTLIETMAAAFVLVMGIAAVAAMATFSLRSSSNVIKQVVGMGLARQGIEAVKNMRDTNWLMQSEIDNDCYNFKNQEPTAPCYRDWLTNPNAYSLDAGGTNSTYVLSFKPDSGDDKFPGTDDIKFWHLTPKPTGPFTLYSYPADNSTKYFYDHANPSGQVRSGYYRSIQITLLPGPTPFDKDGVGPAVRVISRVWWRDEKCPVASAFYYPDGGSCRISLETVLTNWKTN